MTVIRRPKSMEINGITYNWCQNPDALVQPDWLYSYDNGGITAIIAEELPVQPDMVGLPAQKACYAYEYFLIPAPQPPTDVLAARAKDIISRIRNYDECHDGDVDEAANMMELLIERLEKQPDR